MPYMIAVSLEMSDEPKISPDFLYYIVNNQLLELISYVSSHKLIRVSFDSVLRWQYCQMKTL